jgi:uncharacterized protein YbcI
MPRKRRNEIAEPTREDVEEQIAAELVRVHEESYGEGATDVTVLMSDAAVVVILDVVLTQAEKTLLGAGKQEAVRGAREAYQEAVTTTFEAVIERATGRRVSSWVSRMSIDPIYSVEVFRLAPKAG